MSLNHEVQTVLNIWCNCIFKFENKNFKAEREVQNVGKLQLKHNKTHGGKPNKSTVKHMEESLTKAQLNTWRKASQKHNKTHGGKPNKSTTKHMEESLTKAQQNTYILPFSPL